MALKVKAQEKLQKIGTHAGKYRYIMMPELYTSLSQDKVIKEAALRSGVSSSLPFPPVMSTKRSFTPPCHVDQALARGDIS